MFFNLQHVELYSEHLNTIILTLKKLKSKRGYNPSVIKSCLSASQAGVKQTSHRILWKIPNNKTPEGSYGQVPNPQDPVDLLFAIWIFISPGSGSSGLWFSWIDRLFC
jgi:hypothetical protein